ncbi:MAG: hypothetical protein GY810_19530 [Aureispira sp.]|nr:hypothetical protein [Aureispira sp.]
MSRPKKTILIIFSTLTLLIIGLAIVFSIQQQTGIPLSIFLMFITAIELYLIGSMLHIPPKKAEPFFYFIYLSYLSVIVLNSYFFHLSDWWVNGIGVSLIFILFVLYEYIKNDVIIYIKLLRKDSFDISLFEYKLLKHPSTKLHKISNLLYQKGYLGAIKKLIRVFWDAPQNLTAPTHYKWFLDCLNQYCKSKTMIDYTISDSSYALPNNYLYILSQADFILFWLQNINNQTHHQVFLQALLNRQIHSFSAFIQNPKRGNRISSEYFEWESLRDVNLLEIAETLSEKEYIRDVKTKEMADHLASLLFISHGIVQNMK